MTDLPSPQSSPELQGRGRNASMAILLSDMCMFSGVFACQTGSTGQSTGKEDSPEAHPDFEAKEQSADKRWTVKQLCFAELQSDFEQL